MTQAGVSERRLVGVSEMTPDRLAELRQIAEAATPGPWEAWQNPEYAGWWVQRRDRDAGESVPRWRVRVLGHNPKANAEHIASFDPPTVLAMLDEIERLRQTVGALHLDRCILEDTIIVLEQEQQRAGRYLEDARQELAHGRIQSAEQRIIDALVSLSCKERRTDTRVQTVEKSGGGDER